MAKVMEYNYEKQTDKRQRARYRKNYLKNRHT